MAKELLPILLSTAVWGPQLQGHQVLYQCDNSSVVAAIKKGFSSGCSGHATITFTLVFCCAL